jgi:succinate dehydrogenase / fumarate reductase, cytochrome b subunit
MATRERPLSPHLQVYRFAYTMAVSILHRATGVALGVGFLLLSCWLVAAASGVEAYGRLARFFAHPLVQIALIGWLIAFWFHFFAGLRHLAWDAGLGFDKPVARRTATLVVLATIVAVAVTLGLGAHLFGGDA